MSTCDVGIPVSVGVYVGAYVLLIDLVGHLKTLVVHQLLLVKRLSVMLESQWPNDTYTVLQIKSKYSHLTKFLALFVPKAVLFCSVPIVNECCLSV